MPDQLLKTLKIAEREAHAPKDPFQRTKAKLVQNLKQQLKAAEAMTRSEAYTVPRSVFVEEDGVRVRKQIYKPIRTWYWRDSGGDVRFAIRLRNKRIELAKGKTDIIVGDDKALPDVIQTVLQAAEAGELDEQLEKAAIRMN